MKRVLSIQDLSCVGKCSLSIALPVLSAMGCACSPLPTGLLSTHTAFPAPHVRDLTEDILPICRHWQSIGAEFDAVTVGYLASPEQADAVEQVLSAFPAFTVIDPVMGDHGKVYSRITDAHIRAMKRLCEKGTVLLPNVTEAALLAGIPYRQTTDEAYYQSLLEGMKQFGAQTVIITGVTPEEGHLGFVGTSPAGDFSYCAPRIPRQCHGTGDLFAAVFTGAAMQGRSPEDAAVQAAKFVEQVIRVTPEASPFGIAFEQVLPQLWKNQ